MTASHQLIPLKHRGQTGCVPSPSWPLGFGTAWHTPLLVRVLASPAPEPWPVPGVCREEGWKQGQCRELASQTGLSRGVCHPPPAHCYPCVSCGKNNPVAAQRAGECAQVQGWKHEDRGGMLGSGDGLAVPPQHPPAARSEPVLPFPAKAGTGAGSAYATWSRVKYLSGCLMEKQAPLLLQLGGGERAHKHGKEVTRPCLPLGREPWPPPRPPPGCRGGGGPWSLQASLSGESSMSLVPQKGDLVPQRGLGHSGSGLQLAAGSSPPSRDTENLKLWATNRCQQLHSGRTKRCWSEQGSWEVTGSLLVWWMHGLVSQWSHAAFLVPA